MSSKLVECQDYLGNIIYFHSQSDIISYKNTSFSNVNNVKDALDYIQTNYLTRTGRGVEKGVGDNSVVSVNDEASNTATKNGIAIGTGLIAGNYNMAVGKYNDSLTGSSIMSQYGDAFAVGNGTDTSNKSNAFRVAYSGNVYSGGVFNTGGADFAEMYEWEDGNPVKEERRGRFVSLVGEKLKFATENDQIIGITSAVPCIVGNNHEYWHKRYITDIYGDVVYEKINITTETGELVEAYQKKINPDYDPQQKYIPRSERKEWAYVGQLGQIVVCDDGTCQVNGYCNILGQGYATASNNGWRVLKRIDKSHVLVLFYLK